MKGLCTCIIIFLTLFYIVSAGATDYYVRPSGGSYGAEDGSSYHNAWDGFSNISWSTVDSGNGKLFVAGRHHEQMTIAPFNGEKDTPIHVVSCTIANGASTDDAGIVDGDNIRSYGIYWANRSHITIEDIEVTEVTKTGIFHDTYYSGSIAEYITIDGCHMHHCGDQGYYGNTNYDTTLRYVTITNSDANDNGGYGFLLMGAEHSIISKCSSTNNSQSAAQIEWGIGITGLWHKEHIEANWKNVSGTNIWYAAEDHTVLGVVQRTGLNRWLTEETGTCTTDTQDGEWCQSGGNLYVNLGVTYGNPYDNYVRWFEKYAINNTIKDCKATGTVQHGGREGTGIGFDSGSKDSLIEHCYSYSNQGNGFATNYTINCTIRNSISANNGIGPVVKEGIVIYGPNPGYVYNNTVYGNMGGGIYQLGGIGTFKNNIIYNNKEFGLNKAGGAMTTMIHAYNCSYTNGTNWVGITKGGTDVASNPLLTDAENSVFTLTENSPCKDAGVDLGDAYDDALNLLSSFPDSVSKSDQDDHGVGWEIGAYVYEIAVPPKAPAALKVTKN